MDRTELYNILHAKYNDSELRQLCFDLGVNYEDLGGAGRSDKARELIMYCERRDLLERLEAALTRPRPSSPGPAAPPAQTSGATFDMRGAKIGKQVIVQGDYIDQSSKTTTGTGKQADNRKKPDAKASE